MEPDRPLHLLVVEDSDVDLAVLRRHLEMQHLVFELQSVDDLKGLRRLLQEREWDLLLTDFRLPGFDGFEVLEIASELAPTLPCIVFSGLVGEETAADVLRSGARDFVSKARLTRLVPAIRREVEATRKRRKESEAKAAMERQLVENLRMLQTLLETLPHPVFHLDQERRFLACNRALEAMFGRSRDDLLARPVETLVGREPSGLLATWSRRALDLPGVHTFNTQLPLGGGKARDLIFHLAAIPPADGSLGGVVGTIQDITDLKRTSESLSEAEALFSAINRHIVELVTIIDAKGNRLYYSPSYQFVLGYSPTEIDRLSFTDLVHPEDINRVDEALSGLTQSRVVQSLECRLRHKEGKWLHFESTVTLITDSLGTASRALVVARNVTDRKEAQLRAAAMEVQLRHSQKLEAIGQLAAGIAHEINTPTQYIGDNTCFLRDSFRDVFTLLERLVDALKAAAAVAPEAEEALRRVAEADVEFLGQEIPKAISESLEGVARISRIVSAMKDFSHPGGDTKTPTDLHRAIESTATVSRNEWKYVANLETEFGEDVPFVPCHPDLFNQVILNLIVNAAHAIEEATSGRDKRWKGLIRVSTRRRGNEVEVTVADDGIGIPPEIRQRVFEPFFTTKPVGRGTGQGLSIAHQVVVEQHHGRIELDSEPGRGTAFHIYLPIEVESDRLDSPSGRILP